MTKYISLEEKYPIIFLFLSGIFLLLLLFFSSNYLVESVLLAQKYIFIGGAFFFFLLLLCFCRKLVFSFTSLVLSLVVVTIYLLVYSLVAHHHIQIFTLFSFLLLFLFFSNQSSLFTNIFPFVIVNSCTLLALYGLFQSFGIFHTSGTFAIQGNFDNPAGLSACLAVGFPFCFSLISKQKKYLIINGVLASILIVVTIGLSYSRAGMLTITVTALLYFFSCYYKFIKRKWSWIIIGCIIVLILTVSLFYLKKNSALGRLLIWENTMNMIQEKPLLGYGAGGFSAHYMEYQADYFREYPEESLFNQLADNVSHPFNEFLLFVVEYGVVGLILLSILFFYLIRKGQNVSVFHLCILSVAIFSCFSYPLRYPFVFILLAYSLDGINRITYCNYRKLIINVTGKLSLFILIVGSIFLLKKDIYFEVQWGNLVHQSNIKKTEEILSDYAALYQQWNYNPLFLYNYGAILNRSENYKLSNAILFRCEKYLNDYDVQMLLGLNHFELKEWMQAEISFIEAHNMIPSKFLPLYYLVEVYDKTDKTEKADSIAQIILNKPVKVPSYQIDQIVQEMNQRLK